MIAFPAIRGAASERRPARNDVVRIGLAAVVLATLLWAIDNTLTGSVADVDPGTVVAVKCTFGAAGSAIVGSLLGERFPATRDALALASAGAIGYGVSLRWYVIAQRGFGLARTASVFATAPFVGAVIALIMGQGRLGAPIIVSVLLLGAGVWLHLTEMHAHRHRHAAVAHEHAHTHDDGHHSHVHVPAVIGSHSHPHRHDTMEHEHPHVPDLHHRHEHEQGVVHG